VTEQELLNLLNDKPESIYKWVCGYLGPEDAWRLVDVIADELDKNFIMRCGHRKPSVSATGHWDEQKQMTCVDMKISMPGLEAKRIQLWLDDRPRMGKIHYRSHRRPTTMDEAKRFALKRICEEFVFLRLGSNRH
jgi:hypothetical protein